MKNAFLLLAALGALSLPCLSAEKAAGIQSFTFGDGEIVCLQDTPMKAPQSLFADASATGRKQTEAFYEASVNVFLVRKNGRIMLIDAGNDPSRGTLREKLNQLHVPAERVTDIFITHIHPDHVGGLLWHDKPLFPKAIIHIAYEEHKTWQQDAKRRSLGKYLLPYGRNVRVFAYGDTLPGGLVPQKRAGHTPGHTIFTLSLGNGKTAVFAGDIAHGVALQFPAPTFCARYDANPTEAVQSRIQTLQMNGILFGAHFPFPGAALGGAIVKGAPDWSFSYITNDQGVHKGKQ